MKIDHTRFIPCTLSSVKGTETETTGFSCNKGILPAGHYTASREGLSYGLVSASGIKYYVSLNDIPVDLVPVFEISSRRKVVADAEKSRTKISEQLIQAEVDLDWHRSYLAEMETAHERTT